MVAGAVNCAPFAGAVSDTFGERLLTTVTATGVPAPGYTWKKNGVNIPGATSATLNFGSAAPSDAAVYSALVTNTAGTVLSSNASLLP